MAKMPMELENDTHIEYGDVTITRNAGWNSNTITFDKPYTNTPNVFVSFYSSLDSNLLQFTPYLSAKSTTGATIKLYNSGSTVSSTVKVDWVAIGN